MGWRDNYRNRFNKRELAAAVLFAIGLEQLTEGNVPMYAAFFSASAATYFYDKYGKNLKNFGKYLYKGFSF